MSTTVKLDVLPKKEGRNVEKGNGGGGPQKKQCEISLRFADPSACRRRNTIQKHQPKAEPDHQNDLPEPAQFQEFPALVAKPGPQATKNLMDSQKLSQQTAHHQHHQRPEQHMHTRQCMPIAAPVGPNEEAKSKPPAT